MSINLKLFQASNEFRLMRHGSKIYKLQIRSAVLKVCHVNLNPSLIIAHNESLKLTPALYPFWRSDIKSFSVAQGSLTLMTDNIFHGKVPRKIIIRRYLIVLTLATSVRIHSTLNIWMLIT